MLSRFIHSLHFIHNPTAFVTGASLGRVFDTGQHKEIITIYSFIPLTSISIAHPSPRKQ